MIDVVIEGDALAAEMARREIEAIVNERTSTVNMRLKDIPAEFYPFLAGPHNARVSDLEGGRDVKIQIPHYHTWKDQAPPQPTGQGQPVPFLAQPSLPIQISGDRLAAQQARSEIEALVASMRRQLTLDQTPIDRGRHQFIIGDRGLSLHDFLAETGCALIKPPFGVDDDNLYIVGPADKIQGGVDKVMELASQMQSMNVDVAKPHISARGGGHPHARNMTRYFQQKQALAELEQLHDASIVLPTAADGPTAWEVYAKDFKNATKARQDIMNLVGAHPPSRFQPMQVDPFFHRHLQQREAPKIRREHGVHIVFPNGHGETSDLLLVFEAPGSPAEYVIPRQQPSAADVKQHQQAIQQAQSYLQNILAQQQALESRDIEAHSKYNDKIRRYIDREQQNVPSGQFPIQATFPTGRPKASPGFSIRGPSSAVDVMNAKLLAFLEQEEKDEVERGYTTSFDYPQKFANFLIGKRGENINRLRDEFDVEIQVKDGKCELKGPQKKCDACRAHILSQLKKLEDETTHTIKVKPQYHRELIGSKGAQVNRLQDRYNVRVNFPRNAAPTEDDATEGSVKNFRNQAPDEVIIKGPKKGADEAREELLNLLQWTMDNSHSASVSVQQSQVPSLIGAGGREMESLRLATGAQVDIPNARDAADASGRVEIKLKGTKKQVEDAKKLLQERAKVFDETVTKNIDVDRKHHKTLIGTGGANVRKLVIDAGGPDDNRAIAQIVRFPKQGDIDNNIRIQGPKAMVDKIVAAIQAQVEEKAGQVSDTMEVPTEKHRVLIGRGGEARRQLESKFNISIDIPRQGATGPGASQIKLTGQPSDLEAAKEHIAGLIKEQEGETINVPRKFHHDIADNGQFFRRLRNDHKVTVDHAGQQPPPRPAAHNPRGRANGGTAMPLITDDPSSSADAHSWELVDNSAVYEGADGDEAIPWILRGSPESVAKAKAQLEKALADAEHPSWSGYLILPDPKTYRHIIGPGGSQINSIRKKTGTKVQVPRGQGEGEAVEIVGTKEGCEEAKQIILDIVKNAGNGGPRR
jgi:predicted PilT family ATPase